MPFAVCIETIAVNRVRCPDPPNWNELQWKQNNLFRRQMVVMRMRQVVRHKTDGRYKYQVEKEL
jgi:hypothetical protein